MAVAEEKRLDPRIRRTRRLLQQAFLELMQKKSFQSISVQEIAERATVNRATFYAHFEDKYDLLDAYLREEFRQWLADRLPQTEDFGPRSLRQLIVTVLEFLAQVDGHCAPNEKQVEPMFEVAVQDELYKFLLAWAKNSPPPRQAPETAAMVTSWAIFGAGLQWSRGGMRPSPQEMADQIIAVLAGGLAFTPEGSSARQVALP